MCHSNPIQVYCKKKKKRERETKREKKQNNIPINHARKTQSKNRSIL